MSIHLILCYLQIITCFYPQLIKENYKLNKTKTNKLVFRDIIKVNHQLLVLFKDLSTKLMISFRVQNHVSFAYVV